MKSLSIDIETYAGTDLRKTGVYKYAEDEGFEIMLLSWSADGGAVRQVDIAGGEKLPDEVREAILSDTCIKWAYNANFERVCLSRFLGKRLEPESWRCSMVWATYLGLPRSLEDAGAVLGLDKQKLAEGKELIRFFAKPCKPTKANGNKTRNLPTDAPEKWIAYKAYNVRDVEAELAVKEKLRKFPVPEGVWHQYHLDQRINDRGVMVDRELVRQAVRIDNRCRQDLSREMQHRTKIDNPNSVRQLSDWLRAQGVQTENLDKKAVAGLISTVPEDLRRVLEIRMQLARSSVKKYQAMETAVCKDSRERGMFQFYGSRTGRWAGRLVQLQNLRQNHLPDLAEARALVRAGDTEALRLLYDDIPDTLSQLLRTAFIPKAGKKFIVCDFAAIEARVIAWLAGEKWRQEVFAAGKDIYCASASQMFRVPVEKHGINGHLRQKGKIAELALGYGGSTGALKAMGALEMGLEEDELQPLVSTWRNANPNIVRLWWDVDSAAADAVRYHAYSRIHGITFSCRSGLLIIGLPSGRKLFYCRPKMGVNKFGGSCITYEGTGTNRKWSRLDTYGPKLVENIVQAIARDLLCFAMENLSDYEIVMHIHDEVVIEADESVKLQTISDIMGRTPPWAKGLLLRADGYETDFYRKD